MNIFEKFKMINNIYIKNNFFIKKKTYSKEGEDIFINNYFKKKKDTLFILVSLIF